jgi:hypothetical protein
MKEKVKKIYIDGVDFQYEVGHASGGNRVYGSVGVLQKTSKCWEGCGVIECDLIFKKWVVEQDEKKMFDASSKTYSLEDFKKNTDIIRFESAKLRLEYFEQMVKKLKGDIKELKSKIKKEKK